MLNLQILKVIGEMTNKDADQLRNYVSELCCKACKPFFVDLDLEIEGDHILDNLRTLSEDFIDGIVLKSCDKMNEQLEYLHNYLFLNKANSFVDFSMTADRTLMKLVVKSSYLTKASAIVLEKGDLASCLYLSKLKPFCPIIVSLDDDDVCNFLGLVSGVITEKTETELSAKE